MTNKSKTISAGPASSDDFYLATEAMLASGPLILDVLHNDKNNGDLFSLDDGNVADLLNPDSTLFPEHSRLGASIWITPNGRVGYAMDSAQAQSLAAGEIVFDSFLYAARRPNGSLVWSTAHVVVVGANDAPVASADFAEVAEDTLTTGSVATNDLDVDHGAVLRFAAAGALPAGFALASDGSWAFDGSDPAWQALGAGEMAQFVIPYTVTDEHGVTGQATLTLTVAGRNDAPIAQVDVASASEDTWMSGSVATNDSDVDHAALLRFLQTGPAPAGFFMAPDGAWTLDTSGPGWQALSENETMQLVVAYSVIDELGAASDATLTVTVTGRNDAPVAQADSAEVAEGSPAAGSVAANDFDADHGAVLGFAAGDTLPAGFALASDGSWTFDGSDPAWQALAEGETAQFVVPYTVTDEQGATSEATLSVTVAGSNDGPVAQADFASVVEDGPATGSVAANDLDPDHGALLRFVPAGPVPAGFSMAADGTWTLDLSGPAWQALAEGETAVLVVPYRVIDEHGAGSEAALTVTVTGTNDGPVAHTDFAVVVEDGRATGSVAANDVDPDHDALLSFAATPSPLTGFYMASDGSWTLDASNPEYQTLAAGETHQVAVQYTVTDEHGASSQAYLLVAVTGANDAPVVIGTLQNGFVQEDGQTVSGQIGFNDADYIDIHSASAVRLGGGPALGSITIDGFETYYGSATRVLDWHYAPGPGLQSLEEGELAEESFAITISDGHGGTATQVVTVHIRGSGDAPVASPAVSMVLEDTILQGALSLSASDVDHHSLLSFGTGTPPPGFALAPNGDWTFDARHPAYQYLNAGQTLAVVVPYTVADPTGLTSSSTLTITVYGVNETVAPPPVFTGAGDPNDFDGLAGPGAVNNAVSINASPAGGTITGGAGSQTITGSDSVDTIYGSGGNDTINGRGSNDRLYGQAGDDTLDAGWGMDILYGGSGNDILRGQTSQAEATSGTWPITFYGGSGSDTIIGGGNNDVLVGGYGADTMTGGGSIDTFVFNSTLDTGDRITDFLYGVDKLDFRGIDANPGLAGDQAFLWSHTGAAANSLWAVRQGADTVIFGDTDGNLNTAEFMVTLQNLFFIEPSGSPTAFML
jgi:VCBS repeat-containing protein